MGSYTPEYEFTDEQMWAPLPNAEHSGDVMIVTPEIAGNWLDTRAHPGIAHNRKLSMRRAEMYAEEMRAGRWRVTHQGIAFDTEGKLIDGQHRLQAIRNAKMSVPIRVYVNEPRENFDVLDVGMARQASQLYMGGNASIITSAARFLVSGKIGTYQKGMSVAHVLEVVEKWGELETWASDAHAANRRAYIPASPHLAVLAQAERSIYRDKIYDWLKALNSGHDIPPGDMRGHVRERFLHRDKVFNQNREATYNTIAKAWNLYVVGERRQVFTWRFVEGTQAILGLEKQEEGE